MTTVDQPTTMSATTVLAGFVAETSFDRIPSEVAARLQDLFLDTIGVSAGATVLAESTPAVVEAITRLDPTPGPATVIGETRGFSWHFAALLNGFLAHSLDFDDTNRGHPGAAVVSAAISEAERCGSEGRAFFEALAVGYEVSVRIGAALGPTTYDRGFHATALNGIFGATAVIAKLRSFDAATTEAAFGLALSKAAGTMQYLVNGSWNKRLHPGFAAHDAILCATLAETGVKGATAALEGSYGLLTGYTNDPKPAELTADLGHHWRLMETSIKPYPSCRFTHSSIDAALELRAEVPATELMNAKIRVSLAPTAFKIVGTRESNKINPIGSVDAQFSVYFQVALAWLDGRVDWNSYRRIGADDVTSFMQSITVTSDSKLGNTGATVTAEVGGETFIRTLTVPLGHPDNWVGTEALEDKFLGLAAPVYGDKHARNIIDGIRALDETTVMNSLLPMLRRCGTTTFPNGKEHR